MTSPPKYTINLDLPPEQRWVELITEYKDRCTTAIKEMESLTANTTIGKMIKTALTAAIKLYSTYGTVLYKEELQSIADTLKLPLEKIIMTQLCYEMFSACTSVIFPDSQSKTNIHYRTMDWEMDFLKKLTVELAFQRNKQTIFTSISWVGYVGIFTGMLSSSASTSTSISTSASTATNTATSRTVENDNYTVALNFRRAGGSILGNVKKAMSMYWPVGYLLRHVLESKFTLDNAVKQLTNALLISPCYITVCSPTCSYLIVRDCKACVKVIQDSCIVQTNIDPGSYDKKSDILYSIKRRELAASIVNDESKNWKTHDDIIKAFNKHPIINHETVYVTVMDPFQNKLTTIIV